MQVIPMNFILIDFQIFHVRKLKICWSILKGIFIMMIGAGVCMQGEAKRMHVIPTGKLLFERCIYSFHSLALLFRYCSNRFVHVYRTKHSVCVHYLLTICVCVCYKAYLNPLFAIQRWASYVQLFYFRYISIYLVVFTIFTYEVNSRNSEDNFLILFEYMRRIQYISEFNFHDIVSFFFDRRLLVSLFPVSQQRKIWEWAFVGCVCMWSS